MCGVLRWILSPLVIVLASCSRDPGYSQASPEATIATAKQMVKDGKAGLLVKLIHSDDENMRRCLNRLGHTLAHLQDLAMELNRAFPEEVRKLREEAASQTANSGLSGLARTFTGGRATSRRDGSPADAMNSSLTRLFASPFEALEEESANLTALQLDQETSSLLYKGGPIIPAVPILLKQDPKDKRWYFVLPIDLPILNGYFFKTPEAWRTYTGLIATLDNIVKDLTQDVRDGKLKSLNDTARVAGEKAFTSLPFAIIAIDRLTAAERRTRGLSDPSGSSGGTPKTPPLK
ncbi:MAG: hypothetical protein KF691_13950 [Phycisphaeraceae bacterium]|nr:hypothetical protein [Phycisphaeraceae bacterium]